MLYGIISQADDATTRAFFKNKRVPYIRFNASWCVLLPLWCKSQNLGFLWLWGLVPIRTVLGTGAVLLGSVVAVAFLRNFTGVVLGTGCIFE